ncbi:phytoene desaturase family protein [Fervidicoccus fontis]|jgi:phytoene dehydrogenase-like protein|uniref:NAD(P)/FAD-dependent oxidoreductase n=1 Tax=Fervidicoccus fontis TaxID=683846 RepID=A0A7C2ZPM4_9CREN|nr:FAD-dependent oxidoreductase [Fervidicoccus fontis]HEW63773.1 NAD(P)/FAD-dependent oxidoreductase [Fervidicoccus fontis]
MSEEFDVVVIGAGAGGLSSAAFLANAGLKVLVIERLPFIGGRGGAIRKGDYIISVGAGAPELKLKEDIYDPLGLPFDVVVPKPNSIYYINDEWHPVSDKGKLREALTIGCGKEEADKIMKALRRAMTWYEPSNSISFRDWLLQYTRNETALGIFDASFPIDDSTAGSIIRMIKELGPMPYGYSRKGHYETLWKPLKNKITQKNGEVRVNTEAISIKVTDGKVQGVEIAERRAGELKEKKMVKADFVVSNVGPFKTIELAGEKNFDKGYLKEVRETIRTFPWLAVQVVSNGPLFPFESGSIGFIVGKRIADWTIWPSWNTEVSPKGKEISYIGGWIPPSEQSPWRLDRYLNMIMEDLKDISKGLWKNFEKILHVGFWLKQEWPMYRSYYGYKIGTKTPIENLYIVGDAVSSGLYGSAMTGKEVAEDILKRIKENK